MERGPLLDTKLAKLSTDFVACRMTGGSKDLSPNIDAFMRRYDVQGYPTLLVLSPDGGVLARDFDRSPDAILAAMDAAQRTEDDFQRFKAAVAKADDPALWIGLAQMHLSRREHAAAVPILATIAEGDPTAPRWRALADAQLGAEQHAAALASYDKLLALEPSADNHGARARAQAASGDVEGAIAYLQGVAGKIEDADAKGALIAQAGDVLWQHVASTANGGDFIAAEKLMDRLLKEFPDTPSAGQARRFEQRIRDLAKRARDQQGG